MLDFPGFLLLCTRSCSRVTDVKAYNNCKSMMNMCPLKKADDDASKFFLSSIIATLQRPIRLVRTKRLFLSRIKPRTNPWFGSLTLSVPYIILCTTVNFFANQQNFFAKQQHHTTCFFFFCVELNAGRHGMAYISRACSFDLVDLLATTPRVCDSMFLGRVIWSLDIPSHVIVDDDK